MTGMNGRTGTKDQRSPGGETTLAATSAEFTALPLPDGDVAYLRRRGGGGGGPRSRCQIVPLSN